MKVIKTFGDILDKVFRIFLQILVAAMAIVILMQVVFRYFFHSPLSWSEELARFSMIWITFFGASIAFKENSLSRVDLLVEMMPKTIKKALFIITDLIMLVITTMLFKYSVDLVKLPGTIMQKSAGLHLPMPIVYICAPIGLGILMVQIIIRCICIFDSPSEEVSK